MSIFTQLGAQLVKLGNRLRGVPMSSGGKVFNITTPEVFSDIDLTKAIDQGFNANVAVYSIIKKDAVKFGTITRYVYNSEKKEEKGDRVKRHPLLELKAFKIAEGTRPVQAFTNLLNRPNPYESQDAFYTKARAYYKTCGEAFIWLNRGDLDQYRNEDGSYDDEAIDKLPVLEMYALAPDFVTLVPDPLDLWGVLGYILEIGERQVMRKSDVIHWKDLNLKFDAASRYHQRGMPPITPGSKTLEESNSLTRANMRSAQNDGAKAVLYEKSLKSMTPQQQSDVKKVMDAKINNNDVAGSVAAIQGDWGLLDLSQSAHDMQMIERKKFTWQELCFLFDVPPEFFLTDQKYDNMGQAILLWLSNSIIPACRQLDGEFNRVLPKAFGLEGQVFIGSDWTELPEIQKDMAETAKAMLELWCISPDDVREFLGYERLGGDFDEPWVPNGRTPMSKANDPLEDQALAMEQNRVSSGYRG